VRAANDDDIDDGDIIDNHNHQRNSVNNGNPMCGV
jgi:hypothetical protein